MHRFSDAELYAMMIAVSNFTGGNDWRQGDQAGAYQKLQTELHQRQMAAIRRSENFRWPPNAVRPSPMVEAVSRDTAEAQEGRPETPFFYPISAPVDFAWGGSVILPLP